MRITLIEKDNEIAQALRDHMSTQQSLATGVLSAVPFRRHHLHLISVGTGRTTHVIRGQRGARYRRHATVGVPRITGDQVNSFRRYIETWARSQIYNKSVWTNNIDELA